MDNTLVIRGENVRRPPQYLLDKFKYFLLFAVLFIFAGIALEPGVERPYSGSVESMDFLREQMRIMSELGITNTTAARDILLDFRFNCSRFGIEGLNGYYTLQELRVAIYSNDSLRTMIDFVYNCINYAIVSGRLLRFVAGTTTDIINDIVQDRIGSVLNDPVRASRYFVVIMIYIISISFIYYTVKLASNAAQFMSNITGRRGNRDEQRITNIVNVQLPEGMTTDDVIRRLVELRNTNQDANIIIQNAENIVDNRTMHSSGLLRGGVTNPEYGITKEDLDFFCTEIGLDNLSDFLLKIMENKSNVKNYGGKRKRSRTNRRKSRRSNNQRKKRRTTRKY